MRQRSVALLAALGIVFGICAGAAYAQDAPAEVEAQDADSAIQESATYQAESTPQSDTPQSEAKAEPTPAAKDAQTSPWDHVKAFFKDMASSFKGEDGPAVTAKDEASTSETQQHAAQNTEPTEPETTVNKSNYKTVIRKFPLKDAKPMNKRRPHPHPAILAVKSAEKPAVPREHETVYINMNGSTYFSKESRLWHPGSTKVPLEQAKELGYKPSTAPERPKK